MCGIVGFFSKNDLEDKVLRSMVSSIHNRGPDDDGVWLDYANGIGLGHARLSVLDLSAAGHQPMHSTSDRYVMVFNGEIYNHRELRIELEKIKPRIWRGHSDTESLLSAIEQWGFEAALKKTIGMFAIALWDKQEKTLVLARDRMGEKPLYYGWVDEKFVFGSELKSLKQVKGFSNKIDRSALALFLRYNSIPAPFSIYENIFKLEPGKFVSYSVVDNSLKHETYWDTSVAFIEGKGKADIFKGDDSKAVASLDEVLRKAVRLEMEADVPLGAFLSGGVDSSTIVSLMQDQSEKRINTFSIGFDVKKYNEAEHARLVAKHIGTDHYDLYVTEKDALDVIPLLPDMYDEPFADSSQIPTYLVSKIAKKKVTVALTGDAGDELFGGYNRYTFTNNLYGKLSKIPLPIRKLMASGFTGISENAWNAMLGSVFKNRFVNVGFKIHKGANVLPSGSIKELHFKLASQIQNPEDWLINSKEPKTLLNDEIEHFPSLNSIERMMTYDLMTYLPTDILTKVDRAAMAVSLETRVPFLDPNVINFAARLPLEYKVRDGVSKWILREVLYKYVPKELIERPKMGFGVPLAEWLRGPLKSWAEDLLDAHRLTTEGFFNVTLVRQAWLEHLSGKYNHQHQLWNVLMFQAWFQENN